MLVLHLRDFILSDWRLLLKLVQLASHVRVLYRPH